MLKKLFLFFLIAALVTVTCTPVYASKAPKTNTLIYTEEFIDDTGNLVRIDAMTVSDNLKVKVYVNNTLNETAVFKGDTVSLDTEVTITNHQKNTHKNGKIKDFTDSDIIVPYAEQDPGDGNYTPSYPFRFSEYSTKWQKWGHLYGQDYNYTRQVYLLFDNGSELSIIVGFIVGAGIALGGLTGISIYTILNALGVTVASVLGVEVITSLLQGTVNQQVEKSLNEVYVQGYFITGTRIEKYTTKLYDRNGFLDSIKYGASYGGPYTTLSESLHWGIEQYCLHPAWYQ